MTDRRGSERLDAQEEVREMLHPALDDAITHNGDPVPLYKNAPEDAPFPHLRVGPSEMSPGTVQTSTAYGGAQDVTVQISVFSTQRNDNEVSAIKSKLAGEVRSQNWSPSRGSIIRVRLLPGGQIISDPDPQVTYQGISEFEFRIQLPTL